MKNPYPEDTIENINYTKVIDHNHCIGLPFSDHQLVVTYPYYLLDLYIPGVLGIYRTIEVHGFPPTQQY